MSGFLPTSILDARERDFGSGLLLELDRAVAEIGDGDVLEIRNPDPSVADDLVAWCELTGNRTVGPLQIRKGAVDIEPAPPRLGSRLWLYTNFDCNLACDYCCAQSSPRARARRMPVAVAEAAAEEFAADGGEQLMITGGEPFLHPEIAILVATTAARLPVTILTNGMVFHTGSRRAALEQLDRERVSLQISLDSATPELHDAHRGSGSFARARAGIGLARSLGFRVRIAATITVGDAAEEGPLLELLDEEGVPAEDRLIRRVARQGFADTGVIVTRDDLHPEPTVAVDGIWWHPVGITDPALRVTEQPLPISAAIKKIREILSDVAADQEATRRAFRCA